MCWKISNQGDEINREVGKIEAIHILISYFHTFFHMLRRSQKRKITSTNININEYLYEELNEVFPS